MQFNIDTVHEQEKLILEKKQFINELQKQLSDSHLAIYEEKNTVNTLRLDYEDLLKEERSDVRRIKELEALNEEIENKLSNVNFKDCRPAESKKRVPLGKKEKSL